MSRIIQLSLLLITVISISCSSENNKSKEINISVTIAPFADFAKHIVGDRANINTLIPPGVNAHSFELTPRDLKKVLDSDIYFKVGSSFNMEKMLLNKIEANIKIIADCSSQSKMVNNNPHYWLSPENVKRITSNMLSTLSRSFPQHKNYFTNNRQKFISKLDSIDSVILKKLASKKNKILLVYHPAWTYLAEHFDLEEISIEQDGKSPKANDMKRIIQFAKEKGVSCIFFDPHFDEGSVETIARSLNLRVDSLNPLPEDYLSNYSDIGNKLNKHLK